MHVSARFAMADVLKTSRSLNHFAEEVSEQLLQGIPLSLDEEERELLEGGVALLRATLNNVASLISGEHHLMTVIKASEQQPVLPLV